ncbi:uncharacterized protein LOC109538333 isoform X2 [Dendroctonus ponderosae]|uniref:uncharacterized protein LOC109538333 isoform X2 n=1 Tax=Dendroctonus ponderosae TaxID=77166 RepID=UPI002035A92B|nr:uncharacterized protein LOC109538333 isoform X2 [Dendroctonus ponderosae]
MYNRSESLYANTRTYQNPKSFQSIKQPFAWKPPMSPRTNTNQIQICFKTMSSMYSSNSVQSESVRSNFGKQNGQCSTPSMGLVATVRVQPTNGQNVVNHSNNSLGLMGAPKPRIYYSSQNSTTNELNRNSLKTSDGRVKLKNVGDTEQEKLCILTGTVERVIKYGKIFQNKFSYFQVFGSVVSIKEGKVPFENTMLLRDKKGPILHLIYYSNTTHVNIDDFHLGQNLRAVGRMVGPNVMSAHTIRAATEEELEVLPRMCYISDYSVSVLCGDGQMFQKA